MRLGADISFGGRGPVKFGSFSRTPYDNGGIHIHMSSAVYVLDYRDAIDRAMAELVGA